MGARENAVEKYLDTRITECGLGITRAWKKSNRDGVMDQIVFYNTGEQHFVEVKVAAPDGFRSSVQIREANRLRDTGATVTCVYGHTGVDNYIEDVLSAQRIEEEYR